MGADAGIVAIPLLLLVRVALTFGEDALVVGTMELHQRRGLQQRPVRLRTACWAASSSGRVAAAILSCSRALAHSERMAPRLLISFSSWTS